MGQSIKKKCLSIGKFASERLVSDSSDRLLAFLVSVPRKKGGLRVVTPNPEFVVAAQKDSSLAGWVKEADLCLPDGVGLVWAQEFLAKKSLAGRLTVSLRSGQLVRQQADCRLTGTDVAEGLVHQAVKKGQTIYLLGGGPGVAQKALENLERRYPGLKGWADDRPKRYRRTSRKKLTRLAKEVTAKNPDHILVAYGMGQQEEFIFKYLKDCPARVMMGVGGAFDFWAGRVKRAGKGWQKSGLEWLYRLGREPWRLKRQLNLLRFVGLVWRQ